MDALARVDTGCIRAGDEGNQGCHEKHCAVKDPEEHRGPVGDRHLRVPGWAVHHVRISRVHGDDDDPGRRAEEQQEQHHGRGQRHALIDVERRRGDEQHHQGQQLGHLEPNVGHDLGVDPAAELDGVHQGAEVVVGQDHPGCLFGDLTAAAHRHPDVRLLERGSIVDRVTRHGDDQPLALHHPGQPELVLRGDPAEHMQFGEPAFEFLVRHRLQLRTADRARTEPERLTDRLGGDRVVTGDHADVDPGMQRGGHCGLGLCAQRVDDAHHPDERQVVRERHRVVRHRLRLRRP